MTIERVIQPPEEQTCFLDQMGVSKEDPVELWEMEIGRRYGKALAPKYFHLNGSMHNNGQTRPFQINQNMSSLVDGAVNLILEESLAKWEKLEKEGKAYGITTAFEGGRTKVLSQAVSENAGLAAFEVWGYYPVGIDVPACAAIYGIRKDETVLRGALLYCGIPTDRPRDGVNRFFDKLSDASIEGNLLKVNCREGSRLSRLKFNLETFEQV